MSSGSVALDVAIGLVLVYFLLAVLASAIQEFLATLFAWRASALERAIRELLDGDAPTTGRKLWSAFYDHAIVKSLKTWRWFSTAAPTKPSSEPAVRSAALTSHAAPASRQQPYARARDPAP